MKQIIEFTNTCKDLSLATVDKNNHPRVRIFHMMQIDEKNMYFATGKSKEVYTQLIDKPAVELCGYEKGVMLRVEGKVIFDLKKEKCADIYNKSPILQNIYKDANNPELAFFRLEMIKAEIFDLTQMPPGREFFSF